MNDGQPSAALQELMRFGNEHSRATLLLNVAAHDYAAARCLLFNGMFEGLVLGAQAIEKCLKAYLIFADPQRPVKALNHSLPKLLAEASALFPHLPLQEFSPLVERFWRALSMYGTRIEAVTACSKWERLTFETISTTKEAI